MQLLLKQAQRECLVLPDRCLCDLNARSQDHKAPVRRCRAVRRVRCVQLDLKTSAELCVLTGSPGEKETTHTRLKEGRKPGLCPDPFLDLNQYFVFVFYILSNSHHIYLAF